MLLGHCIDADAGKEVDEETAGKLRDLGRTDEHLSENLSSKRATSTRASCRLEVETFALAASCLVPSSES